MVSEVLDDSEGIINEIVEETDLSKEDVMSKIRKKREEYGGLLTEAGAAYSIAKDLGVKKGKPKQSSDTQELEVKDLSDGQGNVDLEARIKRIYSTKEFQRNGKDGNVTNIELKDGTGEVRATLWNKKPLIDKMDRNTPIKINNGYVKKRNDNLEVNVGSYGTVEVLEDSEIPQIEEEEVTIDQLNEDMDDVSLYARIDRVFPMNTFQKEDREGKVTNVIITDGKSRTRLVLWGDHAEKAQELGKNDLIKIEGGYTKENRGETEVHLGWRGRFKVNPDTDKDIPEVKTQRATIKEAKESSAGSNKTIKATVVQAYDPTILDVCPDCGEMIRNGECKEHGEVEEPKNVPILNVILDDGSDVIRATLYRENAEKLMGKKGDELKENEEAFSEAKKSILGEEKLFTGRIKEDEKFDRKELTVNSFQDLNLDREISRLKND